jgi:hypothetical protein
MEDHMTKTFAVPLICLGLLLAACSAAKIEQAANDALQTAQEAAGDLVSQASQAIGEQLDALAAQMADQAKETVEASIRDAVDGDCVTLPPAPISQYVTSVTAISAEPISREPTCWAPTSANRT